MNGDTSLRRRVHAILDRENPNDKFAMWVFRFIVAVIAINVLAAVLMTDRRFDVLFPNDFRVVESISLVVFATEYVLRLWSCVESPLYRGMPAWRARARWSVTPSAIIDLIALAPFLAVHLGDTDLRSLAMLRLLRFLKLARYSPGLSSVVEALRAERHGLLACFVVICGGALLAASAMYAAEATAQPDKLGSIPLALWWAFVTITTVGYGDVVPVTAIGRVIAAFTMVSGIFMLALPVGIVATAFIEVLRRRAFVVTWGMVAHVPLFASLDAATLADLMPRLRARAVDAGETVVPRGQVPRAIFFVVAGSVQIDIGGEVSRLQAGRYFGEVQAARVEHIPARVQALEATQLLVLTGDDIDDIAATNPVLAETLLGVSTYEVAG